MIYITDQEISLVNRSYCVVDPSQWYLQNERYSGLIFYDANVTNKSCRSTNKNICSDITDAMSIFIIIIIYSTRICNATVLRLFCFIT